MIMKNTTIIVLSPVLTVVAAANRPGELNEIHHAPHRCYLFALHRQGPDALLYVFL